MKSAWPSLSTSSSSSDCKHDFIIWDQPCRHVTNRSHHFFGKLMNNIFLIATFMSNSVQLFLHLKDFNWHRLKCSRVILTDLLRIQPLRLWVNIHTCTIIGWSSKKNTHHLNNDDYEVWRCNLYQHNILLKCKQNWVFS